MNVADIQAVVASARARDTGSLERLVRRADLSMPDAEVARTVDRALEIIDELPVLLGRAEARAEARGISPAVAPILARAEEYFLRPVDLIPEMTQGLAGLVDDAYFAARLLHSLGQGPDPLLEEDLGERLGFLRGLMGTEVARRLDRLSVQTLLETEKDLRDAWEDAAVEA